MMDGMMGGGWIMMLLSFLLMILVVGAIVAGVVYLVRALPNPRDGAGERQSQNGSSAQRILDERYARGEIDRDDYIRRRDDLERG